MMARYSTCRHRRHLRRIVLTLCCLALPTSLAVAAIGAAQQQVLDQYAAAAKAADPGFAGFSVDRGKAFFLAQSTTGKPDTPSCSTCHTTDPRQMGRSRAGKDIKPMAVSQTPERFVDFKNTEKWFTRNCDTVLGRACTAREKGDFITYLSNQ